MHPTLLLLFLLATALPLISAQKPNTRCGTPKGTKDDFGKCPREVPCCSEHNICGREALHCGGGCKNEFSFDGSKTKDASCFKNRPGKDQKCVSGLYDFTDKTWVINEAAYNGDVNSADFTLNYVNPNNTQFGKTGGVRLALTGTSNKDPGQGARLSTTSYLMYGTFTARIKVSDAPGVVTAFISMSDEEDEIDWEMTGGQSRVGQSNYFYRGIVDNSKGGKHEFPNTNNLADAYHDYTVRWTKDSITWLGDGQVLRTVRRADTCRGNTCSFPSTPSRIQFAIWDGGAVGGGTRDWAGGMIDWSKGPFHATFQSVMIQCDGDSEPKGPPKRPDGYKPPTPILPAITEAVPYLPGYQASAMENGASSSGGQQLTPGGAQAQRSGAVGGRGAGGVGAVVAVGGVLAAAALL
ncbi:hypothetical protein HK104_010603 [Borealophlyctis nickersoniae]|nr:hypothetical protein HK104_010603 [Borealophlyctis nickersoniae]